MVFSQWGRCGSALPPVAAAVEGGLGQGPGTQRRHSVHRQGAVGEDFDRVGGAVGEFVDARPVDVGEGVVGYIDVVGAVFVVLAGARYDRAVEVLQTLDFDAAVRAISSATA